MRASASPPAHLTRCSQRRHRRRPPGATAAAQDLNLVNGRIHTLDARNSVVSAVAIRNGRIASVGNYGTARARPNTRVIDLRGRTVVPGLIEGHIHSVSLANRPGYHTILENTTSIREIQEALAARRKSVPEGQWITSMGGWHPNQWAEHRHPTLKELDEAVPDRPVLLYERFTGPAVTNSAGKKIFDALDAGAPVHPGDQEGRGRRQRRRSPPRASPAAARRRARCSICGACRRSRTRSAARSTRWRIRPASA